MIIDGITYVGRFDLSDKRGPKFAWSGSRISCRFYGTSISVTLNSFGNNYFSVVLDNELIINALHVEHEGKFILAQDLLEGEHEVEIIKRTEFYLGTVQFLGFDFSNGRLLESKAELNRRIEIIGDSITCGFGMEGNLDTEYDPKYDNAYLSYGALAARHLNAEGMLIGYSGYGMIRDYEGNKDNTLPSKYSYITPEKDGWDFNSWIPQVVIINLGTNDFSFGNIPSKAIFTKKYIDFINMIYNNYLSTEIICTIGPIIEGEVLEVTRDYVKNDIVNYFKTRNKKIHFLEFDHQKERNGYGITYHPSIKTHQIMGEKLTREIKKIMNW